MIKFLTIILLILLILLYPYITLKKPILPMCIKCHQNLNENSFNSKGWKHVNNKIACIDHAFCDGKILHKNLNNKLDESLLNKPPSEYFYSKRIDELNIDGYTKYEVFCYYLGKELKKKYPQILYLRHCIIDHNACSKFVCGHSNDIKFCDVPIEKPIKIKEAHSNKIFGINGIKYINNIIFPNNKIFEVIDWRWFYPYVTIDDRIKDIYGNKYYFWKSYIVRTNTHYYAIGPRLK